jgi:hypothetical protein
MRIWGQVNRLLPLKLVCRWLAAYCAAAPTWPLLRAICDDLANAAATAGSALEHADRQGQRKRDEQLATGLPRIGNAASRDRFISQFVARLTRSGEIHDGAIVQYALAVIQDGKLMLTDLGVGFAQLRNPMIDGGLDQATEVLSNAERLFLVERVLPLVPAELGDFQMAVRAVAEGHDTPPDLSQALRPCLPSDWTDVMVRTHLSGLVARLVEIGGLKRDWNGRRVRYQKGDLAQAIIDAEETLP